MFKPDYLKIRASDIEVIPNIQSFFLFEYEHHNLTRKLPKTIKSVTVPFPKCLFLTE